MMYADTAAGRAEASPGLKGTCPSCGHPCRPKCGKIVIWHWAHHARADCDPWSEPITEWHLGWQRAVPPERREVVMGPHRADIVTASGGVVEIQHSSISPDVIAAREEFYGPRMAWIFDARGATISGLHRALPPPCDCTYEGCRRISAVRQAAPWATVLFRWYSPRRSITACRRPVFLDYGRGGILRLPTPFTPHEESPGALYTRTSVEGWLKDGTPLDRVTLPAAPAPCAGVRPFTARVPAPFVRPAVTPPQLSRRWIFTADQPIRPWVMAGDWLAETCRIVPEIGLEACRTLWREVIRKYREGELAEPDFVKVRALLKARMAALGAPQGPGVIRPA